LPPYALISYSYTSAELGTPDAFGSDDFTTSVLLLLISLAAIKKNYINYID